MKKDTQNKKPFFARLLETQELEKVTGGAKDGTLKYPSDTDDISDGREGTLKYPSDSDDAA